MLSSRCPPASQILAAAGAQPQRFAEVRAVAEQVHVKVSPDKNTYFTVSQNNAA